MICIIKGKYVVSDNPTKHPQSVFAFAYIYITKPFPRLCSSGLKEMFSETELPLCSLKGNVLYIGCFPTGVLTTLNFCVDSLPWCKPKIVLYSNTILQTNRNY